MFAAMKAASMAAKPPPQKKQKFKSTPEKIPPTVIPIRKSARQKKQRQRGQGADQIFSPEDIRIRRKKDTNIPKKSTPSARKNLPFPKTNRNPEKSDKVNSDATHYVARFKNNGSNNALDMNSCYISR